ncbi:MAG: serine hydrolase [Blastocatellia bacterium]|nr:serine hydrolase [Blastocatellia bacterium]
MRHIFSLLLTMALCAVAADAQSLAQLKPKLETLIAASGAETVGVAVYDLESKQTLLINNKISLHAASTMKVPVMMELFRQAAAKQINLDATITIKNEFASIVDGSPYQLNASDDSDDLIYQKIGQPMTIRALIERMIVRSSNLATNILIEKAGAKNTMKLMHKLDANDIQVRRGVEDNKAFRAGLNNTTTAYDLMILLRAIAEKKVANARACEEMLAILEKQEFNEGIPAGLPANTRVAHKTGSITKIYHDVGIVYVPNRKPYVIVVLTRGFAEEKRAHQLVAEISRQVYEAVRK